MVEEGGTWVCRCKHRARTLAPGPSRASELPCTVKIHHRSRGTCFVLCGLFEPPIRSKLHMQAEVCSKKVKAHPAQACTTYIQVQTNQQQQLVCRRTRVRECVRARVHLPTACQQASALTGHQVGVGWRCSPRPAVRKQQATPVQAGTRTCRDPARVMCSCLALLIIAPIH